MIGKARDLKMLEQRTRGLEAKAREGLASTTYLGTTISGILTGYGVRVRYLLIWMIVLFLFSTFWYIAVGVEETAMRNVSYSIITFTTAMPKIPSGTYTQFVAITETFFGTLFTVLLGYILGSRENL